MTATLGDVSNATALPPAHPAGAGSTHRRHSAGFPLAALLWRGVARRRLGACQG